MIGKAEPIRATRGPSHMSGFAMEIGAAVRGGDAACLAPDKLVGMAPQPATEERELIERAQGGDRRAFEALVRCHADRLYAVVFRFLGDSREAEDVTQEAFLRAWRGIGGFKGDAQFYTWLYRIGLNEAKRRSVRQRPVAGLSTLDADPAAEVADWSEAPEQRAAEEELREALERAVGELDPRYREALILRDVEGLSTAEAAAVMGLGEAAFKSRLHRARLAVRAAIDEYLGEDR
ncbi:MAG: RNA polymerase sigma factor [Solirubrobacterales bacterium]